MINPLNIGRAVSSLGVALVPHPQAPPQAAPSIPRPSTSPYVLGTYALAAGHRTREQADILGFHAETTLRQSRGFGRTLSAVGVLVGAVWFSRKGK